MKTNVLVFMCLFGLVYCNVATSRTQKRVRIPLLGVGYTCNGCPAHFCDDDKAIIYGYCCGCATFYDFLPITCSQAIVCPLNGYQLCEQYEYMLQCCCGK